jgi:hypothetical protein
MNNKNFWKALEKHRQDVLADEELIKKDNKAMEVEMLLYNGIDDKFSSSIAFDINDYISFQSETLRMLLAKKGITLEDYYSETENG